MKKITTLCIIAVFFIVNNAFSRINSSFEALADSTACDSLETTFTGSNSQKGIMFDVTAVSVTGDVVVTGFDVYVQGLCRFRVYYHNGTYAGSENDASAWTWVGYYDTLFANALGTPTFVGLSNPVTIPAGQTYSFYLTTTNLNTVNLLYSNGTAAGTVFAHDHNLFIHEGCGIKFPFSGTPYTPRKFNGSIHYCYTAVGIKEEEAEKTKVNVAPNPFTESTLLTIEGNIGKEYQLKIVDLLGKTIKEIKNITTREVPVEKGNMNTGMYFYKVITDNKVIADGKFIVE